MEKVTNSGAFPQCVVKYVRDGLATVQIHGLVTLPVEGGNYLYTGYMGFVTNSTGTKLQVEPDAPKVLVVGADNENGLVTVHMA